MRITLDEKLNDIIKDTIEMGSVIQDTVNDAIKALMSGDRDLAQKIIDNDTIIDDYDLTIEEKCMYILAEHQPVAKDLRLINSIFIIVIYLERIGDISVSIAKLVRRLYKNEDIQINKTLLELINEMGTIVKSILEKALKAFKNKDEKLASKLEHMDIVIDDLQKSLYKKLYSMHSNDEEYIMLVTNLSLASRYLERIGDNSVNIGERIVYFLTGDFKAIHSDL